MTDAGGVFDVTTAIREDIERGVGGPVEGLGPFPLTPPYAQQFSNGPVYSQIAPGLLGVAMADVQNFSLGGARAAGELPGVELLVPFFPPDLPFDPLDFVSPELLSFDLNLGAQMERFLEAVETTPVRPGAAASFLIGGNDLVPLFTLIAINGGVDETVIAAGDMIVDDAVEATLDAAATAISAGVDTVVLYTNPLASFFPDSPINPVALQPLFDGFRADLNAGLLTGAEELRALGVDVRIVDLSRLSEDVEADPGTFGFQVLDQAVLLGSGFDVVDNPALDVDSLGGGVSQVAFFDLTHFSTSLQGVLAAFTEASLTSDLELTGAGDDRVFGGGADDLVLSGMGDDRVWARSGDDVVLAGLGDDLVFAGAGSDLVAGGSGTDRLFGGSGADVLAGGAGADQIFGGHGADGLVDGGGSDVLFGGAGDDVFLFTEASLIGGGGGDRDLFMGGSGEDTLLLALEADTLALEREAYASADHRFGFYTFETFDLTIFGIENVVFTEGFGFGFAGEGPPDLSVDGDLGDRLVEADLFGFV